MEGLLFARAYVGLLFITFANNKNTIEITGL